MLSPVQGTPSRWSEALPGLGPGPSSEKTLLPVLLPSPSKDALRPPLEPSQAESVRPSGSGWTSDKCRASISASSGVLYEEASPRK